MRWSTSLRLYLEPSLLENLPTVGTETLWLNREYAPSKRTASFVCCEKRQPGMVQSEYLFKFLLAENHASAG